MIAQPSPTQPRARWLAARIAELDIDVAYHTAIVNQLSGRATFTAECALEDAIRELAEYLLELAPYQEAVPC